MSAHYWGFPLSQDLFEEGRATARELSGLDDDALAGREKDAFAVVSQLVFEGIGAYWEAVIEAGLPPLLPGEPDDAMQTLGLGLSFWAGRTMQGRSPGELRDLACYLESSLVLSPARGEPMLAFPVPGELAGRIHELVAEVQGSRDEAHCREVLGRAVIEITESVVRDYYARSLGDTTDDMHGRQVVRYGVREARRLAGEIVEQLSAGLSREHLTHFAGYVQARLFEQPG